MRTFLCSCGNQLFFDNVTCMRCKRAVGWCPVCEAISDVTPDGDGAGLLEMLDPADQVFEFRFVQCLQSTRKTAAAGCELLKPRSVKTATAKPPSRRTRRR